MVEVYFKEQDKTVKINDGDTILDAARKLGIVIESPCNAIGTCGKCKVKVNDLHLKNIIHDDGHHHLKPEEIADGYVLSCQAKVYENIEVLTKNTATQNKTLKILSDGQSFSYEINNYITKKFDGEKTKVFAGNDILGEENGDTTKQIYGIAVDIGTTTVVVALINMLTGEEITSTSALNPQSLHAQDVLTRIKFASDPNGLETMYKEITQEINNMIKIICEEANISSNNIYEVIYSGNTTMIHLATNVNPLSLGRYPYTPQIKGGNEIKADMLNISPFGLVYLPPIISSYVGPDITSGVLASQLEKKKGITLFIDIGTNGEMVIAKNGSLSATSTAAGPAFEGMNITYGMRAGKGAIELFEIDEDNNIEINTIGNTSPTGICGSGLLDIVGELVKIGVIGKNGKFMSHDKGTYSEKLHQSIVEYEGKLAFKVTDNVYLTQKDVRQVQLAKGAVRAGIEALLLNENVNAEDVDRVEIAGSFGYHLRVKSLINIGLLPKEFEGKVHFVGNTSKSGGKAFLLNQDLRKYMEELVGKIDSVELANRDDFDKIFVRALNF
jgi:uncharacterized 2Fe-2S/4Fe-4S cluster protein (DUF4445 family)